MPLTSLAPATRRRLRRIRWRTRRPLAALCAGIAALLAVQQLRPADPPTVPVLVAARDLAAGAELTARDVVRQAVPVDLVPAAWPGTGPTESAGVGGLAGRRLAVPVPAGLPLVPGLLVPDDATGPPGTVVVPVRFADPGVASVLRPGVLVDVVAAPAVDGADPERLARAATVLGLPTSGGATGSDDAGLLGGGTGSGTVEDVPVLLAVTPDESVRLGGSAGTRVLAAVIVG